MRKFLALGVAIGLVAFGLTFAKPAKADFDVEAFMESIVNTLLVQTAQLAEHEIAPLLSSENGATEFQLWLLESPVVDDVDVQVDMKKLKIKVIGELIVKLKLVRLDAQLELVAEKFAEAEALIAQNNRFNTACENCAEKTSLIQGSINFNDGIVSQNQSVGNMNNQAIVLSIAIDAQQEPPNGNNDPGGSDGFAEAQMVASQHSTDNRVNALNILFRFDTIESSINSNTGIVSVNQAAGSMNNQLTGMAIAISLLSGVALSEGDLGQENTDNLVVEWSDVVLNNVVFKHDKRARIANSILNNSGIVAVNQATGNMANQANDLSLAAAVNALPSPGVLSF